MRNEALAAWDAITESFLVKDFLLPLFPLRLSGQIIGVGDGDDHSEVVGQWGA